MVFCKTKHILPCLARDMSDNSYIIIHMSGRKLKLLSKKDVVLCSLLAAFLLAGSYMIKKWHTLFVLVDKDVAAYSLDYIQSLEGFRGSIVVANISQSMFWLGIGVGVYYGAVLFFRSIINVRQFYIVERFYLNRRPFYADFIQIIIEFFVGLVIILLLTTTFFLFIPFWLDLFELSIATGSFLPAIGWILFINFSLAFTLYVTLFFYRLYINVRRHGIQI